jgi:hypothetical protein
MLLSCVLFFDWLIKILRSDHCCCLTVCSQIMINSRCDSLIDLLSKVSLPEKLHVHVPSYLSLTRRSMHVIWSASTCEPGHATHVTMHTACSHMRPVIAILSLLSRQLMERCKLVSESEILLHKHRYLLSERPPRPCIASCCGSQLSRHQ